MSGKWQDCHHHHQQQQQPQQSRRQRSTRFKGVVRRVLIALSFHVGHRHGRPQSLPAVAAADSADDSLDAGLIMTSSSTVTSTVCRLAAVEEEQRDRCNSLVRR